MHNELAAAKERLDQLIAKGRVDLYKPIQIAEVLHRCRTAAAAEKIDLTDVEDFRNPSRAWRDDVTLRLLGKRSTSSARYQDDIWNESAMPPKFLVPLDKFNRHSGGVVEAYIYRRFAQRQGMVSSLMEDLKSATPATFRLVDFLARFESERGLRRSVDKAYEIVAFAILDLLVRKMGVEVSIDVPESGRHLLADFDDLARVVLGVTASAPRRSAPARIYRVGVTNAADRGLDMWANFGPAIQVKHLSLDPELATEIVEQVDADRVIVVCCDTEAAVVNRVLTQLPISPRVGGIIQESDLVRWYERALRGTYASILGKELIATLTRCFESEFPQATDATRAFIDGRGYNRLRLEGPWAI